MLSIARDGGWGCPACPPLFPPESGGKSGVGVRRMGEAGETPRGFRRRAWRVLRDTVRSMISDRISMVAAGCAFYATLAFFPALSMLVFLYGLIFDPVTVEPQLSHLRELVPPSVYTLIEDRVHELVSQRGGSLTIGLVVSTLITLWSSATGTKSLMAGLNLAQRHREERGFFRFQATAFALTLCSIAAVVLGIALLVALPVVIALLGLSDYSAQLLFMSSLGMLVLFMFVLLMVVFRFGPSRPPQSWRSVVPGALLSTLLWVVVSALFSIYVGRLAAYDRTYGPLAAAVGVMMWLWVSVYVVLVGAELNAELEAD